MKSLPFIDQCVSVQGFKVFQSSLLFFFGCVHVACYNAQSFWTKKSSNKEKEEGKIYTTNCTNPFALKAKEMNSRTNGISDRGC